MVALESAFQQCRFGAVCGFNWAAEVGIVFWGAIQELAQSTSLQFSSICLLTEQSAIDIYNRHKSVDTIVECGTYSATQGQRNAITGSLKRSVIAPNGVRTCTRSRQVALVQRYMASRLRLTDGTRDSVPRPTNDLLSDFAAYKPVKTYLQMFLSSWEWE